MTANVYNAGKVGTWTITAAYNGLIATAAATVLDGTVTSFYIQPAAYSLTADESVIFTAIVKDSSDNTRTVTSQTTFTADDPAGTMSANIYHAGKVGTWTITAAYSGFVATASVKVACGTATAINLQPAAFSLTADESVVFTAVARDSDANTWTVTGQTAFTTDDPIGTMTANIYQPCKAGTWTITAACNGLVATTTVKVACGTATALILQPTAASLTADESVTFTTVARDSDANTWTVTGQTAFTTDDPTGTMSDNVYHAGKAGTWTITAAYNGFVATASVKVACGTATAINLQPAAFSLTADESVDFTAVARDSDANTWTVTGQTAFTTNDPTGTMSANAYYAGKAGTWTITATCNGLVAAATVKVTSGTATAISLQPSAFSLTADESVAFTAAARDSDGNTWTVTSQTAFTTDDPAGTMTANVYDAGKIGTWTITAAYNGLIATAAATVLDGTVTAFYIQPAADSLTADESVIFTAIVRDSSNNTRTVTSQTTFTADDPAGTMSANIYHAGKVGTWTITAAYSGFVATASVKVACGTATAINLQPAAFSLTADESVDFTAVARDSDANTWTVTGQTAFTTNDPTGTMSANAYYAGKAGTWTITATCNGLVTTATVKVTCGTATSLILQPSAFSLTADESVTFTAVARDSDANTWTVTGQTAFTADDPAGTMSANVYHAGKAGTWTITAACNGLVATATVKVTSGTATAISLQPSAFSLTADKFVALTCVARDSDGNTWTVTSQTTFTTDDPAGTMFANIYQPCKAGIWTITATFYGLVATMTTIVNPGPVAILTFIPPTAAGTLTVSMPGEMTLQTRDRFGNVAATTTTIIVNSNDAQSRFTPLSSGASWTSTGTFTLADTSSRTFFFKQNGTATSVIITAVIAGTSISATHTITIEALSSSSSGIIVADDGRTTVEIGTGAVTGAGYIEIDTSGTSTADMVIAANGHDDTDTRIDRIEGTLRRFEIRNATITTAAKVRIAIPYPDADPDDGYVDGTGIWEGSLWIYTLVGTGTTAGWQPVEDSWRDPVNNVVYADVPHFSYYILMGNTFQPNLEKALVYPNPFYADRHSCVYFDRLSQDATIWVFNIAGELVHEIRVQNSPQSWDIRNSAIASGIYIYLIKDNEGNRKVGKLGVIR